MPTFNGGSGADTFTGTDGDDVINGNAGNDTLNGADGDDQITGGAGADQVNGGAGNDVFVINAQSDIANGEHYSGGTGFDRMWLTKSGLNLTGIAFDSDVEWLYADSNATVALGAAQLDGFSRVETGTITINKAGIADLTNAAVYTQSFNLAIGGVTLNLTGVTTGNHIVTGSTGVDTVIGSENTDFLFGLVGNDVLNGDGGDDQITGGAGADQISGGAGNDVFFLGAQGDVANGEHYSGGTGFDQVTLNANNLNLTGITFDTDVESLYTNNGYGVWLGAAQLDGFSRVETGAITIGKAGVADLTGAAVYTSTFNLAASGITLNLTGANQTGYTVNGSTAADIVTGGENGDHLFGKAGNDTLSGGAGDDEITGGAGSDTMYGGGGNDTFFINAQSDVDLSAPPGKFPVPDTYHGGTGDDTVVITTSGLNLDAFVFDTDVERLVVQNDGTLYTAPDKLNGFSYIDTGTIYFNHGGYVGATADLSNKIVYTTNFVVDTVNGIGIDLTGCSQEFYTIQCNLGSGDFKGGTKGDTIIGGGGDDTIEGNGGADYLDGGSGTMDLLSYEQSFAAVSIDLAANTVSGGDGEGDTIANFDGVIGSAFDDALTGNDGDNHLQGNDGDDVMAGGKGGDQLDGNAGSDTLNGGDGDDTLDGGAGDDTMIGGKGDDSYVVAGFGDVVTESAGEGTDEVRSLLPTYTLGDSVENLVLLAGGTTGIGNALANTITGSYGDDTLDGAGGADTLAGCKGNDTYIVDALDTVVEAAGEGTDTIRTALTSYTLGANVENLVYTGSVFFQGTGNALANAIIGGIGDDVLTGARGNDTLDGGAGSDTASYAGAGGIVTVNLVTGTATGADGIDTLISIENVIGGAFNDTLVGSADANVIDGGAGADKMSGGDGDDFYIVDNVGDKVIESAGQGTDTVFTALAAYTLAANIENLTFTGTGTGTAKFTGTGNNLANVIDTTGASGNDTLVGLAGDDTIYSGAGNDTLDGGAGDDFLDGGDGFDVASFAKATAGIVVDLEAHTATGQGSDTLFYIEGVIGSDYADTLTGGGPDTLLSGGKGNDLLVSCSGNDTLDGGLGIDTASYAAAIGAVRVDLTHVGAQDTLSAGWDTLTGIENVTGSNLDDRLFGNDLANTLTGGAGDDVLSGGLGNDVLVGGSGFDIALYNDATGGVTVSLAKTGAQNTGGAGTDTLTGIEAVTGSNYNDTLTGSAGDDTLEGEGGSDVLQGGAGYDVLTGGAGADVLIGGLGTDVFVFRLLTDSTIAGADRIADFDVSDMLDLSRVDADTTTDDNQAFTLTDAFHHVAGELISVYDAATHLTTLSADADGDALADFAIVFNGNVTGFDGGWLL